LKLSDIKQILVKNRIQLTKSLGQNFMHDGNQLRRIVDAAALEPSDPVLEVGPGLGPLTELLIEKSSRVLAVEKDGRLCEILAKRFADSKNFELVHADALEYLMQPGRDWSTYKLVSNLPYSVASRLIVSLALDANGPRRIVTTLQKEVALRLRARADDPNYGLLSLLVQFRYQPLGTFKVPASCFFPAPDIDSACVTLERRAEPLLPPSLEPIYEKIVRQSFSQRRKIMFKLLRNLAPEAALIAAFSDAEIPLQARAETVSLEQFMQLAKTLSQQ
jgi:16S rRNA (adenine1518-N6/adenine1519-N6)-dimethyltransferase